MFALQLLALSAGSILVYAAIFLYPTEDALASFLEMWWIRVDDVRLNADARHAGVAQALAAFVSTTLDRIYGPRLWSREAVDAAFVLSASSYLIGLGITYLYGLLPGAPEVLTVWRGRPVLAWAEMAGTLLLVGFALSLSRKSRMRRVIGQGVVALLGVTLSTVLLHFVLARPLERTLSFHVPTLTPGLMEIGDLIPGWPDLPIAVPGFLASVVSDVAFVVAIRRLIRSAIRKKVFGTVSIFAACLLLTLALYVLPSVPGTMSEFFQRPIVPDGVMEALAVFAAGNNYTGLGAVLLILACAALLIDRALWPVIARVTYTPLQHGLYRNRRAILFVGMTLIAIALPGLDLVRRVRDLVLG